MKDLLFWWTQETLQSECHSLQGWGGKMRRLIMQFKYVKNKHMLRNYSNWCQTSHNSMVFAVLFVLVATMEGNPPAKWAMGDGLYIYKKQKLDSHLGNLTYSPFTHMRAHTHKHTKPLDEKKFVRQIKGTEDPKVFWELSFLTFQFHFYLFLKPFSVIPIIKQLRL